MSLLIYWTSDPRSFDPCRTSTKSILSSPFHRTLSLCSYLSDNGTQLILQSKDLLQTFLDCRRKREESQCVTCGSCIEHHHTEVHVLHQSTETENHCLCNDWKERERRIYFITSEKLTASSMPGNDESISWNIDRPTVHSSRAMPCLITLHEDRRSFSLPLSSLSSGNSLIPPDGSIS